MYSEAIDFTKPVRACNILHMTQISNKTYSVCVYIFMYVCIVHLHTIYNKYKCVLNPMFIFVENSRTPKVSPQWPLEYVQKQMYTLCYQIEFLWSLLFFIFIKYNFKETCVCLNRRRVDSLKIRPGRRYWISSKTKRF